MLVRQEGSGMMLKRRFAVVLLVGSLLVPCSYAAFMKNGSRVDTQTGLTTNGDVITVTADGTGFIYDIFTTHFVSIQAFLAGTVPPATPGVANPGDFVPVDLR